MERARRSVGSPQLVIGSPDRIGGTDAREPTIIRDDPYRDGRRRDPEHLRWRRTVAGDSGPPSPQAPNDDDHDRVTKADTIGFAAVETHHHH